MHFQKFHWRYWQTFFLALTICFVGTNSVASQDLVNRVWGTRPLLSYFALTQDLANLFQDGSNLTDNEFEWVEQVAYKETAALRMLFQSSQLLISGDAPLWWKRMLLLLMGYNRKVDAILEVTDDQLQSGLDPQAYLRLVAWIEQRWPVEKRLHSVIIEPENAAAAAPRTFRVYATRYDSNGRYTVALPDKCVKFTNGGNSICSDNGYVVGQKYQVYITYKKSVGVIVAEAGPWNVDDAYWANWNDPTPRRMFADVGLGIPEAQAAYFNGYNGGLDQFGRKVTGPFGIDLAREVSEDIGLKPGKNDWVTVTFLWTEGWGSSVPADKTRLPGGSSSSSEAQAIVPVEIATPLPDGSIIHMVQPGQTLWDIATVYETTIRTLYSLNNLNEKSVIWPGDRLVIRTASSTSTGSPIRVTPSPPTSTPTIIDATGTAWAVQSIGTQAVETVMAQIMAAQRTPTAASSSSDSMLTSRFLIISLVILVIGAVLLLVGKLVQ